MAPRGHTPGAVWADTRSGFVIDNPSRQPEASTVFDDPKKEFCSANTDHSPTTNGSTGDGHNRLIVNTSEETSFDSQAEEGGGTGYLNHDQVKRIPHHPDGGHGGPFAGIFNFMTEHGWWPACSHETTHPLSVSSNLGTDSRSKLRTVESTCTMTTEIGSPPTVEGQDVGICSRQEASNAGNGTDQGSVEDNTLISDAQECVPRGDLCKEEVSSIGRDERLNVLQVPLKTEKPQVSKRVSFIEQDFVPCYATFTPKLSHEAIGKIEYRAPERRVPSAVAPPSSVARPNYHDALRRVSVVVYQHIKTCTWRLEVAEQEETEGRPSGSHRQRNSNSGRGKKRGYPVGAFTERARHESVPGPGVVSHSEPFNPHTAELFHEKNFLTPKYKYIFLDMPLMAMNPAGFSLKKMPPRPETPTVDQIHDFLKTLFTKARLSSECSLVCLIYVERLMEIAQVPLLNTTWKPVLLCGLLLASKVWQDLSSWNFEFSDVYPEFTLKAINRLEMLFLNQIQWNLSISSSLYAKYYFALRSLTEKKDFRRRYNQVLQIDVPRAKVVQERSNAVKEDVARSIALLSRSL